MGNIAIVYDGFIKRQLGGSPCMCIELVLLCTSGVSGLGMIFQLLLDVFNILSGTHGDPTYQNITLSRDQFLGHHVGNGGDNRSWEPEG